MKEISFSNRLARAFLDAYQARNPADVIEALDLWAVDLPTFDFAAASGKYKVMRGLPHSDEEGAAWARVTEMAQ